MRDENAEYIDIDAIYLLLLIVSAAFSYSVLRRWGYRLHYPIAAIVEDWEVADEIASKLGIFNQEVYCLNLPPVEFRKNLNNYHDDIVVLSYTRGRYSAENMETIFSNMTGGTYQLEMDMVFLLVFQEVIPEEYQDKFSIAIQLDKTNVGKIQREEIEEYLDRFKIGILTRTQVVEYEVGKLSENFSKNLDNRFWTAVLNMVVFLNAFQETEEKLRKQLQVALRSAYDLSNSYEFNQQIPALFREALEKSIPTKCKLLQEEKVSDYLESDLKGYMLYDSEFYYVPEELFKKICEPLNQVCTDNQIKAVLAKEGILCTQGRGRIYRTLKKTLGGSSFRFVWLKRDALEGDTMEMSFVDIFQIRKAKLSGTSSKEGGKKKIGAVFKPGEVTNKPGGRGRRL